jgi:hypothetical protein
MDFVNAGGLEYADGVSIHPYFGPCSIAPEATPLVEFEYIQGMQNRMSKAAGNRPTPFYFTEAGFSDFNPTNCISEEKAADWAMKFALLLRTLPYVKGIWWYELVDESDVDTSQEGYFGLYKSNSKNRAVKPIASALKKISNSVINGYGFKVENNGMDYTISWKEKNGSSSTSTRQARWTRGVDNNIQFYPPY